MLAAPVQFYVGWPFIRGAAGRACRLSANMDTLIAIGTLAAFFFSVVKLVVGGELYFETAALLVAFLVLAATSRRAPSVGRATRSGPCWSSAPRKPGSFETRLRSWSRLSGCVLVT